MTVNLIHLCELMTRSYVYESQLRIPTKVFKHFATRNNFIVKTQVKNNKIRFKLYRKEIPIYYISGDDVKDFHFLDLGDIHIGNLKFDESSLRKRLAQAQEEGIKQVFIAGDLFEGCCNSCEHQYLNQIEHAYRIFKDYPFSYYAINGNHEYSFEQLNYENPINRLQKMLRQDGVDFHYFDTYIMDFVICGVIKRVMHIENIDKSGHDKSWTPAINKLDRFDEDGLLQNFYKGKLYTVRLFQIGHIHMNMQRFYSRKKVYISQAGSFIGDEPLEEKGNFIKGRVANKKVVIQFS